VSVTVLGSSLRVEGRGGEGDGNGDADDAAAGWAASASGDDGAGSTCAACFVREREDIMASTMLKLSNSDGRMDGTERDGTGTEEH